MPRNGSGTMTVVNSFSPGTTISSSQVNANNTDIADELTNSLALDGQSTMSGQLKAADGTDTAPGITFGGDLDTGFYRSGTNTFKAVVSSGTVVATFGTSGLDAPTLKQNGTAVAVLGANTFTADQTITSTDAGQVGPALKFYHNSASPAASDGVGYVTFNGKDGAGNETTYAKVFGEIVDTTDTSEDGRLAVQTVVAGSLSSRAYVGAGIYTPNATGGDKGADTINATTLYAGGKQVGRIQRQITTKTDTSTIAITAGTFSDVTGLSVSITAVSGSRIVIKGAVTLGVQSGPKVAYLILLRDSTVISPVGASPSNRKAATWALEVSADNRMATLNFEFEDTAPDGSAHTYKLQMTAQNSENWHVNRSGSDTDNNTFARMGSWIAAEEYGV